MSVRSQALSAALFVLVCTLIGWLVGHPLAGLIIALGILAIAAAA
jgi:hypothetical protein